MVGVLELMDGFMQACPSMVIPVVTLWLFTVKPVPTMVIVVPPAVVPLFGVILAIVGAGIFAMLATAV